MTISREQGVTRQFSKRNHQRQPSLCNEAHGWTNQELVSTGHCSSVANYALAMTILHYYGITDGHYFGLFMLPCPSSYKALLLQGQRHWFKKYHNHDTNRNKGSHHCISCGQQVISHYYKYYHLYDTRIFFHDDSIVCRNSHQLDFLFQPPSSKIEGILVPESGMAPIVWFISSIVRQT